MAKKRDYVGIYKANKNNNGSVAQFKIASQKDCMFLELAKQIRDMNSDKPYDWENTRITIKLGESDIGKLISLFSGTWPLQPVKEKEDLMLYHQRENGSKIIKIKKQERGYYMKVSMKEGGKTDAISIPISWDEAELIKIALVRAYEIILGW